MKKHFTWRMIALAVVMALLYLLLSQLLRNTIHQQNDRYTLDIAHNDTAPLITILQKGEPSAAALQAILQALQKTNPQIVSIAVVSGRSFAAHTDSSRIGTRITKEIFDIQRSLQRSDTVQPELWMPATQNSPALLYRGVMQQGELKLLIVYSALQQQEYTPASSRLPLVVSLLGFFVVAILLEHFIPRFSAAISLVFFIITVVIITSGFNGQIMQQHNQWQQALGSYRLRLDAALSTTDATIATSIPQWYPTIAQSIKTWNVTLSVFFGLLILFVLSGLFENMLQTFIRFRLAYSYIIPAMFGVFLLVFFPFVYGFLIGFTNYGLGDFDSNLISYFSNLGNYSLGNFVDILRTINLNDPHNFYFTLLHTILWTVLNVTLHVSIGVGLALILNNPKLKGRTFFRVVLILPWAIPNYITALIWRGMFHKQFGAVNGLLELLGFEPISWFTQAHTAFLANLATNVWLGFPFMMIIALGALQSIPKELYEASSIDGSSRWQSFWNVTFPLLKPAMIPAIILGTIWTFNQFNVIYLVSGGGPDGATELLITDAYKLAFEQYRYGYAAAYCIVIFVLLFAYGAWTNKISKASQGVYE
jgi:ABC-type sugar transport system permease subunit